MKKSRFIAILFTILSLCSVSISCRTSYIASGSSASENDASVLDAIKYGTLIVFHETPPSLHVPNHDRLLLYRDIPDYLRVLDYTNPRGMYTQSFTVSPNECIVGQWSVKNDTLFLQPSIYLNPDAQFFPRDTIRNIISRPIPQKCVDFEQRKYLIKSDLLYDITDYTYPNNNSPKYDLESSSTLKKLKPMYKLKTFCSYGEIQF